MSIEKDPTINIGGLRGPEDKFRPITFDKESKLTFDGGSFRIFAIKYEDPETAQKADGALFEVEPDSAMPVMQISEKGYRARRQVVEGSGKLLVILPSGEVKVFDVSSISGKVFEQGEGWTDTWIAGPDGLKIIDSSEPAFQMSFETEKEIDDPSLPGEFWQKYHELLGESKP